MQYNIRDSILTHLAEGRLPCAQAIVIARDLGVEPAAVGQEANDSGVRISACQLGLFGYGPKAEGLHKIVRPMPAVSPELANALQASATDGALTCLALWQVADSVGIRRLEAAGAAESLHLRISHCQLGCFPRPGKG